MGLSSTLLAQDSGQHISVTVFVARSVDKHSLNVIVDGIGLGVSELQYCGAL